MAGARWRCWPARRCHRRRVARFGPDNFSRTTTSMAGVSCAHELVLLQSGIDHAAGVRVDAILEQHKKSYRRAALELNLPRVHRPAASSPRRRARRTRCRSRYRPLLRRIGRRPNPSASAASAIRQETSIVVAARRNGADAIGTQRPASRKPVLRLGSVRTAILPSCMIRSSAAAFRTSAVS